MFVYVCVCETGLAAKGSESMRKFTRNIATPLTNTYPYFSNVLNIFCIFMIAVTCYVAIVTICNRTTMGEAIPYALSFPWIK